MTFEVQVTNETNLYQKIAADKQMEKFILFNNKNVINPLEQNRINQKLNYNQHSNDSKMSNQKILSIIHRKENYVYQVKSDNSVLYECNRIIQTENRLKNVQNISLTYNGEMLNTQQKLFKDIWPQQQFIDLIAIEQQQERNKISLIIQDQYKIILNQQFDKHEQILNDQIKKIFQSRQFFLYYGNRVIKQEDTFESLFANKVCCKLYIVYPQNIESQEEKKSLINLINVSLLQFGEIIQTLSIKPKQEIYPIIEQQTNEECLVYHNGEVISKTAKFSVLFENQKDVCLIILPKIYYLKKSLEIYENKIKKIKEEIENLGKKLIPNNNELINLQNSYYFYFQNFDLFKQYTLKDFQVEIEEHARVQTVCYQEILKDTLQIAIGAFKEQQDDVLELLAQQQIQSTQGSQILQKSPNLNQSEIIVCKYCQTQENRTKCTFEDCKHSFHIDCLYQKVYHELRQQLEHQNIQEEILFSCSESCKTKLKLKRVSQFFSSFQQQLIQNYFIRYYAQFNANKKQRTLFYCINCQFVYFNNKDTEFPQCQCDPNQKWSNKQIKYIDISLIQHFRFIMKCVNLQILLSYFHIEKLMLFNLFLNSIIKYVQFFTNDLLEKNRKIKQFLQNSNNLTQKSCCCLSSQLLCNGSEFLVYKDNKSISSSLYKCPLTYSSEKFNYLLLNGSSSEGLSFIGILAPTR